MPRFARKLRLTQQGVANGHTYDVDHARLNTHLGHTYDVDHARLMHIMYVHLLVRSESLQRPRNPIKIKHVKAF